MADVDIDSEVLISLIEERPGLWDKRLDLYKDQSFRTSAWRDICCILNPDFEDMEENAKSVYAKLALKKWTNIRDCWKKSISINKNEKKYGSGKKHTKPYVYHKQLKFLLKNSDSSVAHESIEQDTDQRTEEANNIQIIASTSLQEERRSKKRKRNKVDAKMITFTDHYGKCSNKSKDEGSNRHLLFFKSLLPSLESVNDDQTLEFQSGVIALLQSIKKKRTEEFITPHNYECTQSCHTWPHPVYCTQPMSHETAQQNTLVPSSPSVRSSSTQDSFTDFKMDNF